MFRKTSPSLVRWNSLLIDLYKETKLLRESSKVLGILRGKGCDILENLDYYDKEVAASLDEEFHIKSVRGNRDQKRNYEELFGKISDSHNEIEKLGVCRYGKPYTTIISLEDSLDYVLHRLSGASIENIRNVRGYDTLSRALMKLNYEALQGFTVDSFLSLDARLDKYVMSLFSKVDDSDGMEQNTFLLSFIRNILMEASSVTEYVSFYFNSLQEQGTSVIRSKSFCTFVITSAQKLDGEIIIRDSGYEDYKLLVRSFEKKEYASNIELKYAE